MKRALIIVDVQNDFMPGGALGVSGGDEVVPIINELMEHHWDLIVASKDWHPEDHGSFNSTHSKKVGEIIQLGGLEQILWPVHAVANTFGSEFVEGLNIKKIDKIFLKGVDKEIDSYSAFFDNGHRRATGLGDFLKSKGITDVYIVGIATDYCVLFSALDALKLGFHVHIIQDACRGVNLKAQDSDRAISKMRQKGAEIQYKNEWE